MPADATRLEHDLLGPRDRQRSDDLDGQRGRLPALRGLQHRDRHGAIRLNPQKARVLPRLALTPRTNDDRPRPFREY
jgi:hypothetical protein